MKIKTAAFLIFSQLIIGSAFGQMVLGGDITWQCLNSGTNAGKYIFKLTLFNQCDSGQLGASQTLDVINGPVSTIGLNKISEVSINPTCYDTAQQLSCANSTPGVMSMAVYESSPTILNGVPGSGGWIFTWKTNSRQLDSSNIASASGMTLRSVMYSINSGNAHPCMDNSPQFIAAPITAFCMAYQASMTNRAYDPDRDVVEYTFDDPLQNYTSWPASPVVWKTGYSATSPLPGTAINSGNTNVTLDQQSGDLTFQVSATPDFTTSYVVKSTSKRNGNIIAEVYRELVVQHMVCPPSPGLPPLANAPPSFTFRSAPAGPSIPGTNPTMSVMAGDTVRFFVDIVDFQFLPGLISGQTVRVIPRGEQFGAGLLDPLNGCPNIPCATIDTSTVQRYDPVNKWIEDIFGAQTEFTWVTDSVHGSPTGELYHFHFYAQDNWCPYPGLLEKTMTVQVYSAPENTIEGTVYRDLNGNGTQDAGENGLPNVLVKQSPSNFYFNSNSNGGYALGAYQGTHTVNIPNIPKYYQITSPSGGQYTLSISGTGGTYSGNDFGLEPIPNVNDLEVDIYSSGFHRAGLNAAYYINYVNVGTTTLSGSVDFSFNGPENFVSAVPSPSSTGTGTASWSFTNLGPGQGGSITVMMLVDSTAGSGDSVFTYVSVNPISGDTTPVNNLDSMIRFVTASFDPNIKRSEPAKGFSGGRVLQSDVNQGLEIEYMIEFQNTGNDTAFNVRIEDEINQTLDMESFQFIGASDPVYHEIRGRKITWYFNNIKLPDSATDFNGSMGFVKFRMTANNTLSVGDTIENTADIFFDLNAPISTTAKNGIVAMVDGVEELSLYGYSVNIYPNPSSAVFNVDVTELREERLTYEVYSISGSLQFDGILQRNNENSGRLVLDLTGHPQGIYFVRFSSNDQVLTRKIVLR